MLLLAEKWLHGAQLSTNTHTHIPKVHINTLTVTLGCINHCWDSHTPFTFMKHTITHMHSEWHHEWSPRHSLRLHFNCLMTSLAHCCCCCADRDEGKLTTRRLWTRLKCMFLQLRWPFPIQRNGSCSACKIMHLNANFVFCVCVLGQGSFMELDCGSFLNSCTCPPRRSRLRPRTATLNMSGMVLSAEAGHVLQPLLFLDPLQDLLLFLSAFPRHFSLLFKEKPY